MTVLGLSAFQLLLLNFSVTGGIVVHETIRGDPGMPPLPNARIYVGFSHPSASSRKSLLSKNLTQAVSLGAPFIDLCSHSQMSPEKPHLEDSF